MRQQLEDNTVGINIYLPTSKDEDGETLYTQVTLHIKCKDLVQGNVLVDEIPATERNADTEGRNAIVELDLDG